MGYLALHSVHCINPLRDARWEDFVSRHIHGSIFHTTGWLRALHRTYGLEPLALTTSGPHEKLNNAVLFCSVKSWLTGNRLVSVPFADHCDVLADDADDLRNLLKALESQRVMQRAGYIEIRPLGDEMESIGHFRPSQSFCHHILDLRPSLDSLFRHFHKACVQRKIRRSEREGLTYEVGRSKKFVDEFYHVFRLTRRRRHAPPQSIAWFQNLVDCLGETLRVGLVRKNGLPVAGMVTLRHGSTVFYKYGGSDAEYHRFGGMQMLLWQTIREAKYEGYESLDLGRSDWEDDGLITFKDRWGAQRRSLHYWQSPKRRSGKMAYDSWHVRCVRKLLSGIPLPDKALEFIGKLAYKHLS